MIQGTSLQWEMAEEQGLEMNKPIMQYCWMPTAYLILCRAKQKRKKPKTWSYSRAIRFSSNRQTFSSKVLKTSPQPLLLSGPIFELPHPPSLLILLQLLQDLFLFLVNKHLWQLTVWSPGLLSWVWILTQIARCMLLASLLSLCVSLSIIRDKRTYS